MTTFVESNAPAEVGKRLINTPRNSGNIWTTYEMSGKLSLGGGARFVGRRFGNTINTRSVGSYWSLDAMVIVPGEPAPRSPVESVQSE